MSVGFRSEEMCLAQLFIQPEAAYFAVSELGELGTVQFRDLNENVNAFQRKYVTEVRRCDEMERRLRYVEAELKRESGVELPPPDEETPRAPNPREIIDLEAHLEKTEGDIRELSESAVNLKSNYLELTELRHVLEKTRAFFDERDAERWAGEADVGGSGEKILPPEEGGGIARGRLGFVAGVVDRERVPAFERMLWRISRGNVFLRRAEIAESLEDPATGQEHHRTVFAAFFQGEQLKTRIKKVCAGFHAALYPCPSEGKEREDMLRGVRTRLEDLNLVLNQTLDHRRRCLAAVARELRRWHCMCAKTKAIFHTLNCFNVDVTRRCLIGECWLPVSDIERVKEALRDGSTASGSSIPSFLNVIHHGNTQPPTFNRCSKFTRGFQNLIDAYGVATYREASPTPYTLITFPFLFAVMFGDCGHAVIMFLFGAYLCLYEKSIVKKRIKNEIFNIFFGGRYIILLMGIFSFYTGFVYNDLFSKPMNLFGTRWYVNASRFDPNSHDEYVQMTPKANFKGTPFFFGVDPTWLLAENKIIFLNSFKMKLSIIFGVIHMIFGVIVSTFNMFHFKKYASIILEFLPQLLLMLTLFLYLVIMMFMKWILFSGMNDGWDPVSDPVDPQGSACAPSVLIYFINMMLNGDSPDEGGCEGYMYPHQKMIQMVLVVVALITIPWMLCGKPLHEMYVRKHKLPKVQVVSVNKSAPSNGDKNGSIEMDDVSNGGQPRPSTASKGEEEEEEETMGDIWIHQAIHTIEYSLSTISHTASYLRLWALSLAHAQLSEVLWSMILKKGLALDGKVGSVAIFVVFAVWAAFTVSVLVLMEGLSAFLHTLRLHWVEFMSKFYVGMGYMFQPFSFKEILDEQEDEME